MNPKQLYLWVLTVLALISTIAGCNLSKSFSEHQERGLTSTTRSSYQAWQKIQLLHTFTGNTEPIAISPNGQILASDGGYGKINLWNLRTGQLLRTLSRHSNSVMSLTFSPDGQTLVSSGIDKKIKIWHWDTGELIRTLSVEPYAVFSVDITPDGQTLVSGSGGEKNTVKIWNLKTGELLRTSKHSGAVESVDITPDGQTLAVANRDGTIELWANGTGKLLHTLAN
jgi:WD40 repeat protein